MSDAQQEVWWVPLESNPDALNTFAHGVGLPEGYGFVDVWGVDAELLGMVPRPCLAVTLLFPMSEANSEYKEAQDTKIKQDGQEISEDLFYMSQVVRNACGTVATMHILANTIEETGLPEACAASNFFNSAKGMTPQQIGSALAEASEIHAVSEAGSKQGQTETPEATMKTEGHFISFVCKGGDLYELDGRKNFPINHGPIQEGEDLLTAAAKTIKTCFMDTDPTSTQFNMMVLVIM